MVRGYTVFCKDRIKISDSAYAAKIERPVESLMVQAVLYSERKTIAGIVFLNYLVVRPNL